MQNGRCRFEDGVLVTCGLLSKQIEQGSGNMALLRRVKSNGQAQVVGLTARMQSDSVELLRCPYCGAKLTR